MSKIARIRILNLNYNNNTIKIDDEMFDFNGQNTLISLRNGGGKSVLVQMIVSLFVNRSYRDFGDRPFKSYFTTNRPTFIMTEWILDNKADRFLAGMMVRKSQREDNDAEELEMYTFTGNYSKACSYDIENLPVIRQEGSKKILRGFSECKNLLEEISKSESRNFRLYDMTSSYGRGQYFNKLREYQVNNKEWESIIRKVNQKESGLSELFQNAKDEKNLVENWFLRPIEDKLNQEKNKTDEFRKLAFQFIEQYKSNQSKIQRKGIIERYFEDTKPLKVQIDDYVQKDHDEAALRTEMILYVKALQRELKRLETEIAAGQEKIDQIKREQRRIVYEKLSYGIYIDEDRKTALLAKRTQQETAITELTYRKNQLTREIDRYDLHKLYQELKDFERQKAEVDAKLQVLLQKTEESKDEIGKIGSQLYALYSGKAEKLEKQKKREEENRVETENTKKEVEKEFGENEQKIRKLGVDIGALTSRVKSFDEVEDTFNREFSADLRRNIVGLYVDGALEIFRKEMEAGLQEKKNESAKYAGKLLEQEQTQKRLSREIVDGNLKANDLAHQLDSLSKKLLDLEKQKNERLRIMKYVGMDEAHMDQKNLILNQLDGKMKELDMERDSLIQKKAAQEKQLRQLKEGKTTELPENIRTYLEQNGIDPVYGMEWLTKNGRTAAENAELVKKNPFIPYSVVMERADFERFRKNEEELYTSFPIPIIIKDELEQERQSVDARFAVYGNVHFYVMFNTHLLDREELEKILDTIRRKIESLKKSIGDKESDLETYRNYRSKIESQTFSTTLYQQTEKEITDQEKESESVKERLQEIRREQGRLDEEKEETKKLAETVKRQIDKLNREKHQFDILCKKYEQYETERTSLERLNKENTELTAKESALKIRMIELQEQEIGLRALVKEISEQIDRVQKQKEKFETFAETAGNHERTGQESADPAELEARYYALTKEISDSVDELRKAQNDWIGRIQGKKKDIQKKNEDSRIPEEEYRELICPEEQYDSWKCQKKQTEKELNQAVEKNVSLGEQLGVLKHQIETNMKNLKKETGFDQPVDRKTITDINFEERWNLQEYDLRTELQKQSRLQERNIQLSAQVAVVAEYEDEMLPEAKMLTQTEEGQEDALTAIQAQIPDIRNAEIEAVKTYQKEIRRKMAEISKALDQCRLSMSEMIREIASGKEYADDYFRKTFDSLLSQTASPQNLSCQFELNRQAYENQLEKLKIDLAHIDDEQKNLEMMFLEYIEQINANIGMIDKNSTISVRGRSLKMLRIQVPDWETEKEHFRLKLHDYFEHVVKMGIETIEKNENLTEFLGRVITTKKLYDDIVGIQNVKIRLYKIEAEREVAISWSEVSANSGGEGFLSAFVILTCLLSYMRRDETDIFNSGEEGKVLIMDNPFAQTNAEHLLKPLIEMAKKTNTQLICLSGLGGDSIYNRFDNIYVLKLIESSIRNGVQRVDVTHVKGDAPKRMVLSDFKMEQISMFDMEAEE